MARFGKWRGFGLALAIAAAGGSNAAQAAPACDRTCLVGIADRYLAALVAHRPEDAPLSPRVVIAENMQRVAQGDGLWRTATSFAKQRQYVADVEAQQVGVQTIVYEGAAPAFFALRLKVADGRIAEAETLLAHDGEGGPPFEPDGFLLREAPYIRAVPAAVRSSRADLLRVSQDYWTRATTSHAAAPGLFTTDCFHFQNGVNTDWERELTPPEAADPAHNAPQADDGRIWTCARELVLTTVPWTGERAVRTLVDPERGLVMTWNLVDVRGRPGPDGRMPTLPAPGAPLPPLPDNAPPGLTARGWATRGVPQTLYHAEVKRIVGGGIQREQVFQRSLPVTAVSAF